MDLTLDDEEEALLASITNCLDGELPLARLHESEPEREAGERRRFRLLADMGWFRAGLEESLGGSGLRLADEVLLFRELGRRLAPVSCLAATLSGRVAAIADEKALADEILDGRTVVALAVPEQPLAGSLTSPVGPLRLFSNGAADLVLLASPEGAVLMDFAHAANEARPCLDRTVTMRAAQASAGKVVAHVASDEIWHRGLMLLAAQFVAHAEAARDMITDYAKLRETFGRPIGAYQAVRHPIADMAARCEQARSLLFYAALALGDQRADGKVQAIAARAIAQAAASANDAANIHFHGGIGVTDDLAAHLYMKRTTLLSNWFGAKSGTRSLLDQPLMEI
jgi:alkylation response protein AidB-like acyl-CoA dehydrogenase